MESSKANFPFEKIKKRIFMESSKANFPFLENQKADFLKSLGLAWPRRLCFSILH